MQFPLPYFGEINLQELKEYYDATTDTGISLDLNFEHTAIDASRAELIKQWLLDLETLHAANMAEIRQDIQNEESTTYDYIRYYIDDLSEEEMTGIIGTVESDEEKTAALLSKLELKRVGFYPDGKYDTTYFAVFDYTIDINGDPCDQLLVLKWGETPRQIEETSWES